MAGKGEQAKSLDWEQYLEEALNAPGSISQAYSRFYSYSFLNQINLVMQGCPLEPVATYNRWKAMGRQVLRGSKAFEIIRPIMIPKRDENGDKTDESYMKFKGVRCIFPVSMTEGDELPEVTNPAWEKTRALGALGITEVKYQEFDGNTQGYSFGKNFAINPVAEAPRKTMFHELGHIVIGHTTPDQLADYQSHRGIKEFQAESTALLVGKELDELTEQQTSNSRGYIQHWIGSLTPAAADIRAVFSATDKILKAGYPVAATEAA